MHKSDIDTTEMSRRSDDEEDVGLLEFATVLGARWRLLVASSLGAGALALGASYLIPPTFTARTIFLPPQQQQGATASALASLGALAGLAGGASVKTPGDQYVSFMQSVNIEDRIVDQFKLMSAYDAKYRFEARHKLEDNVRITLGKKDGLITIDVDDKSPETSAAIANQYVVELRRLSSQLVLTEAQQRRSFFETELKRTKERLNEAQQMLQDTGFNAGALKAEPKAAADAYARLKAEATSAEVGLQTLKRTMADSSSEVQQQVTLLSALRGQLQQLARSTKEDSNADYVSRYREYKYQETLFELFSRQYEAARMDESRDGALLQVIDVATPPEHKSKPKRLFIAVGATLAAGLLLSLWLLMRHFWMQARSSPKI